MIIYTKDTEYFKDDIKLIKDVYNSGLFVGIAVQEDEEHTALLLTTDQNDYHDLFSTRNNGGVSLLFDELHKEWKDDENLIWDESSGVILNSKNINKETTDEISIVGRGSLFIDFIAISTGFDDLNDIPKVALKNIFSGDVLKSLLEEKRIEFEEFNSNYKYLNNYLNTLTDEERLLLICD